jgi:hypothetical protein
LGLEGRSNAVISASKEHVPKALTQIIWNTSGKAEAAVLHALDHCLSNSCRFEGLSDLSNSPSRELSENTHTGAVLESQVNLRKAARRYRITESEDELEQERTRNEIE